jgi:hypothetical protein
LYELFEDLTTRRALRKAYEMYLKKEAPEKEVDEPPYGVMPVKGNYGQDVRVAMVDSSKSCIICQEYVPSIRSDKPCIVAYPLIRGDDNNLRPFLIPVCSSVTRTIDLDVSSGRAAHRYIPLPTASSLKATA